MTVNDKTFDWEAYEGCQGNKLIQNNRIKGQNKNTKVYSFEPYAQELFDIITNQFPKTIRKDLEEGDVVQIVDIMSGNAPDVVQIELEGGLVVDIDLSREKKFISVFGHEKPYDFLKALSKNKKSFLDSNLTALVLNVDPIRISLWEGYIIKTKNEFMKEIENPTKAYIAKIHEANKGGYFVEVQGVEAFMPGSLAAPNKIADFMSMVGKEVVVMVEDYIKEMNSFIVSHKKYIEYVLPSKIKELSLEQRYIGTITGTSKYGIFIEFDDIFTGLLHVSKMSSFTSEEFKNRQFKAGDEIGFYISEITKDNRIILTEESPEDRFGKIQVFVDNNKSGIISSRIAAIMKFGIIVNNGEISGLIPNKEFRKKKMSTNGFSVGEEMAVVFSELKDNKIIFALPDLKDMKAAVKEE